MTRMMRTGESYGQATDGPAILNQPRRQFQEELRSINDNLQAQIDLFNQGLDRWFEHGEMHPPYYPWRIAVILGKRRKRDKEFEFLTAYCSHFLHRSGSRDLKIKERAKKLGIIQPAR